MKKSLSSATLRRMTTYLAYLRSISERLVQNEYLLPALAVFSHDEALHEVSEKELA